MVVYIYITNTNMKETWKEVEDYPMYEVSNLGRVRSLQKNRKRILSPYIDRYAVVQLSNNGKRYSVQIGRLVAKAFIPNPEDKPEVNHKDGNKLDNWYLNLEWVTPSENILHAHHHGLFPYRGGEECNLSRLTEKQILEIRKLKEEFPNMTYVEIGKKYNASGSTIRKIILRHRWKHL